MNRFLSVVSVMLLTVAFAVTSTTPASALPVPSKSADHQTLADREADLEKIREVVAQDEVSQALEAYGLTQDEVNQRLAQLSPEELHQLNGQIDQLHAAGQVPQYIWILITALYTEEPPVLVGGAAVELYTGGTHTTGDLDFVGSVPSVVERLLREAGFQKSGRHWVHEAGTFLEFPGATWRGTSEPPSFAPPSTVS